MIVIFITQSGHVKEQAYEASVALASADIGHVIGLASDTAASYDQYLRHQTDIHLRVAQSMADGLGVPADTGRTITWAAKNQFTAAVQNVSLPGLKFGKTALNSSTDPNVRAAFVDEVRDLTGATCTIFQKMNAAGDMLRVSTNVIAKSGRRATGTFIPSVNPDGQPNPVVSKVLGGGTFIGRAFVVDSWYMAAYKPIRGKKGELIGMLYVGVPERSATEDLKSMLHKLKFGASGNILIFNATGINRGQAFWPEESSLVAALNAIPGLDGSLLNEICSRAPQLASGETATFRYTVNTGEAQRQRRLQLVYYQPWDWVIGIDSAEDEVFAAANRIRERNDSTQNLVISGAAAGLLLACVAWWFIAGSISGKLSGVAASIRQTAAEMSASTQELAAESQALDQSSTAQSTAITRSTQLGEQVNQKSGAMAEAAAKAAKLMETVRVATVRSDAEVNRMMESMAAIAEASNRVSSINKLINTIAFETRILALNASVEAARAGEAGASFSVVAHQVGRTAERCSEAASETTRLIGECISASANGEARLRGLVGEISTMSDDLASVNSIVAQVATMSREQSGGLGESAKSFGVIRKAALQVTGASLRRTQTAEQLNGQGALLNQVIDELDLLCGSRSHADSGPQARGSVRLQQAAPSIHTISDRRISDRRISDRPILDQRIPQAG